MFVCVGGGFFVRWGGVDVGAIDMMYSLVRKMADDGLCVIVISAEFEETHSVADRLIVMNDGRIAGDMVFDVNETPDAATLASDTA